MTTVIREGGVEHVSADNMEPVRSYIADWVIGRFEADEVIGPPIEPVQSRTCAVGPLESSVRQDHPEKAYRRYQMREALPPSQKRHKRGKNQER